MAASASADSAASSSRLVSRLAPYLILLLFALAVLWPLVLGRSLYWGDILLYFDPMLRFGQETLQQGKLPLWNPYLFGGQPYLGNPQCSLFYPLSALLPFVPVWLFLSVDSILHVFLCGAFAYAFLRRWTVWRVSALAGGLVYMGSACILGRVQFPPMIQTAPYFPLFLLCLDKAIDSPGIAPTLGLAITTWLIIVAGHAQVGYLIFLCGMLYAAMRLMRQGRTAIPCLVAGFALGLLLAAAMVLPTLQLFSESPREKMTAIEANRFYLEPAQLLTLIFPRFLGHPASRDYWGSGNAWEPAVFIGWLPLALVGYAVARCSREKLVRFWAIVALVGLLLAFGNDGGVYWLAFHVIPGLSNFHDPARFLFLTLFGFVVLTGVGLDALWVRKHWKPTPFAASVLLMIALPLWWYGWDWNPTTSPSVLKHTPPAVNIVRAHPGRVSLPGQTPLLSSYIRDGYHDYGPNDARYVEGFEDTLDPNLSMRYRLESASGYEPVPIQAAIVLDGLTGRAFKRGEPNFARLIGLSNASTLALPTITRYADPRLPLLTDAPRQTGPLALYANRDALPRAWLVRHTRRVEGSLRQTATLAAPEFHPANEAILSAGDAPDALDRDFSDAGNRQVVVTHLDSASAVLRADAGPSPAFLVYSGTADPGWKATVDGRDARLRRADIALMGLFVPPGSHTVRLTYAPSTLRLGIYLSLLACVGIAALLCSLFDFRFLIGNVIGKGWGNAERGRKL